MLSTARLYASLLAILVLLGTSSAASFSSAPVPPSQDPWYTSPFNASSLAFTPPGTILRVRATPGNLTSSIANVSSAYNIMYRTTDSRYLPSWAVTTLLVPKQAQTNSSLGGATALLSYQIPYDSAAVDDSPSYTMHATFATAESRASSYRAVEIETALGNGWYVNVPDFEGPLASFTAGVQSGHATIDSIRAALSSGFGLADISQVTYAMWGYSGGALATGWAAELAVQYAPEMNFAGAVLGGLTPEILSVANSCSGTICASLIPSGFLGLASQFPDAEKYIISKLKTKGPYNETTFLSVKNASADKDVFLFQDIFDYFINGEADINGTAPGSDIVLKAVYSDGKMGYHGVPQMPLYVYKAVKDEVSPVSDTDALIKRYCEGGSKIVYERNTIGGHAAAQLNGLPKALEFLGEVLSGTYDVPLFCSVTDVAVNTSSSQY